MKIKVVCQYLEKFAPLNYQESYDNCGLNIGDENAEVENILVSLDVTLEVINEAITKKCNLIIAHHPIIFKGLKQLNGKNYVEEIVIKAIKNDIAIYASHTNLDNALNGVNFKIAEKLELKNIQILQPKSGSLLKLTVLVPCENKGDLLDKLHAAGAGNIGNYSNCSFSSEGMGSFKPNEKAKPVIGQRNKLEFVEESKVEVILPLHKKNEVLKALFESHPYEEVAYYLEVLENLNTEFGSGSIGELTNEMDPKDFLAYLKEKMQLNLIKHTELGNKKIKKVAICGGAGSFLLQSAIRAQADVFVSSDFKYHEFFDAENKIIIADIGHFESEQYTKELIVEIISKKFTNFATYLSQIDTNPVKYYF